MEGVSDRLASLVFGLGKAGGEERGREFGEIVGKSVFLVVIGCRGCGEVREIIVLILVRVFGYSVDSSGLFFGAE